MLLQFSFQCSPRYLGRFSFLLKDLFSCQRCSQKWSPGTTRDGLNVANKNPNSWIMSVDIESALGKSTVVSFTHYSQWGIAEPGLILRAVCVQSEQSAYC